MIYQNPEQIRCRINVIGRIINEARNYGRRSLPAAYADFQREYDELHAARADCTWTRRVQTSAERNLPSLT